MIFTTFYTESYAEKAERLRASLERQGLRLTAEKIESPHEKENREMPGGKEFNEIVKRKPGFLFEALSNSGGQAVVWLDADLVVYEPPIELWLGEWDIAATETIFPDGERRYNSAVIALRHSPKVFGVLNQWRHVWDKYSDIVDDLAFDRAVRRWGGLEIKTLPDSYFGVPRWRREALNIPESECFVIGHVRDE